MTDRTSTPKVGQRFVDEQGVHWLVQAVTPSGQPGGSYTIRIAFGEDKRCEKDVWILGHLEYENLLRERNLKST
jgi:hypothetical protein